MILRFGPYTTVTTSFLRRHAVGTDRSTVAAKCHRVRPEFESLLDPLESGQVLEDQQGVTEQRGVGLGPLGFVSADRVFDPPVTNSDIDDTYRRFQPIFGVNSLREDRD